LSGLCQGARRNRLKNELQMWCPGGKGVVRHISRSSAATPTRTGLFRPPRVFPPGTPAHEGSTRRPEASRERAEPQAGGSFIRPPCERTLPIRRGGSAVEGRTNDAEWTGLASLLPPQSRKPEDRSARLASEGWALRASHGLAHAPFVKLCSSRAGEKIERAGAFFFDWGARHLSGWAIQQNSARSWDA